MDIIKIMKPIKGDLKGFARELDGFINAVDNDKVRENFRTFFAKRGKHIRPSLLFLAAGSVNKELDHIGSKVEQSPEVSNLQKLGLVLELLHSASLVHDDIIDGDDYRRGNKTVNSVFGNKVGVLAGDTLFSYAFALATDIFPRKYNQLITGLTLDMCRSELIQANGVDNKEAYLSVIKGKTAQFMSVSCELGAMYAGASDLQCQSLKDFGMNLGMTYQIIDDFNDKDPNALKYIKPSEATIYYDKAVENLAQLEATDYKKSLQGLLDFVIKMK